MRVCLVLGAGSSLANAEFFHSKRRSSTNPPLDYTFFDKIKQLKISVPRDLRRYAASLPTDDPFEPSAVQIGVEEFFRDLFSDFQDSSAKTLTRRAYAQLVGVYVAVLRETTDWMGTATRSGPVGRLIQEASDADGDLVVLTFNHDLVIENEIHRRARLRGRWCLPDGYGSLGSALRLTSPRGVDVFRRHDTDCRHDHQIRILKLHGSLNWFVPLKGEAPTPGLLTGSRRPPLRLTPQRSIPVGGPKLDGAKTWPVLVPPIHSKEALIRSHFSEVWKEARETLRHADRVVFFGYSLPSLDLAAQRMFQHEIISNSRLRFVEVINPAPESARRYAHLTKRVPIRWYPSLASFFDEKPFLDVASVAPQAASH